MTENILAWPSALKPNSASPPRFMRAEKAGPETLGMTRQTVELPGGRWTTRLTFSLNTSARVRAVRGLIWALRGHSRAVRVPVFDVFGVQMGPSAAQIAAWAADYPDGIPHSDGSMHSDGEGYAVDFSTVSCDFIETAAAGSYVVKPRMLRLPGDYHLQPGCYIQIDDILHGVSSYDHATRSISIEPELRKPITSDSVCYFSPTCVMSLADPESAWAEMEAGRRGSITLNFVEAYEKIPGWLDAYPF